MRDGIPRFNASGWGESASFVVKQTSERFGDQWTSLADSAWVTRSDLLLHLPSHWSPSVFRGLVLDLGCGMGRYANLVAGEGGRVVAVDLNEAVDAGHKRFPEVSFVQADLSALPFAPHQFDLAYSFGVLHHLPDPAVGL